MFSKERILQKKLFQQKSHIHPPRGNFEYLAGAKTFSFFFWKGRRRHFAPQEGYVSGERKVKVILTCRMAVRNPCGLKKPVIQKTLGLSLLHQCLNWVFLSNNSVYQKPKVVDSHETLMKEKVFVIKPLII